MYNDKFFEFLYLGNLTNYQPWTCFNVQVTTKKTTKPKRKNDGQNIKATKKKKYLTHQLEKILGKTIFGCSKSQEKVNVI